MPVTLAMSVGSYYHDNFQAERFVKFWKMFNLTNTFTTLSDKMIG